MKIESRVDAMISYLRRTIFAALATMTFSALADEVSIPGTSVSLMTPAGFTVSSSFSGLENTIDGSSITIAELPADAYDQLHVMFSNVKNAISGFRKQGVVIERSDIYSVGDQRIPVLIGRQPVASGEVGKYMALFRGKKTVLMTFNVFDERSMNSSMVKETISSVRLGAVATLDQKLAQLPFSFAVSSPFRIGDVYGGSAVSLPSFEGVDPTGLRPALFVAVALAPALPKSSAKLVSQQLVHSTNGFESAEIVHKKETLFAGGQGFYVEAIQSNRKLVQFLRISADDRYIRLMAFGERSELNRVMPAVSEIAKSVAFR